MSPLVAPLTILPLGVASEGGGPDTTALALIGLVSLAGLAALAVRLPRLRGTTLTAPWTWSVVALTALALSEMAVALTYESPQPAWIVPLRLAAALSTFCPSMALLGAKRPQDRAWQFIVLALWAILSLPSLEWLFFGGVQEIHPARFWFLAILIGAGAFNGLATRSWTASLLYCGAQVALIGPYFPEGPGWLSDPRGPLVGMVLLVAAWTLQAITDLRSPRSVASLDRVWLDFRDAFGVLWSLRVMERMNATASLVGWPVLLSWQGFVPRDVDATVVEVPTAVEESFRTLLRRFVSAGWIDRRMSGETQRLTT